MKMIWKILKTLFKIVLWLFLILILLGIILYFAAGKLVQHFAPNFITQVTQTETSLGKVDLSLFSGHIELNNLQIGNPAGFKDKNIFELGHIVVDFDPNSVLTNKIIVKAVKIGGVKLSTELNTSGKTNISLLMDNVNKATKAQPETGKPASTKTTAKAPSANKKTTDVVVRDLVIDNSSVRTGVAGQILTVPLPEIHMTGIGEKENKSLTQVAMDVLTAINVESAKATAKAVKNAALNSVQTGKDTVKNIKDTFKNLF